MFDVVLAVEELALSGAISMGRCSRSTAYRNTKQVREYLESQHFPWDVRLKVEPAAVLPYTLYRTERSGAIRSAEG